MTIAYLNGVYLPLEKAAISPMDRGFLFGDGVYEVIPVYANKAFRLDDHLLRLKRSLSAIAIHLEVSIFKEIIEKLIEKNPSDLEQAIYLQVTRGHTPFRDYKFKTAFDPTIFSFCMPMPGKDEKMFEGVSVITLEDIRWQRCDIKSINLLPNVLLQHEAQELNAFDAILIREGNALEGTATNLFIVKNKVLFTPPLGQWILGGITRSLVLELAKSNGISIIEQDISVENLASADEIWLTSSSKEIIPVISLNGKQVGSGKPGPLWQEMRGYFLEYKKSLMSL